MYVNLFYLFSFTFVVTLLTTMATADSKVESVDSTKEECKDSKETENIEATDACKDEKSETFPVSDNPFDYVNKIQTNEQFKLHISNIPRYVGYGAFKKKMSSLGLNTSKIKLLGKGNDSYAFLVFKSEEEMEAGFKILDNLAWKSCNLQVKRGKPSADPFVLRNQKRKNESESGKEGKKAKLTKSADEIYDRLVELKKMPDGPERQAELSRMLCESTEPLSGIEYPEQLKQKSEEIKKTIRRLLSLSGDEFCEIKASPDINGYRNKVEFTISYGLDDKPTVGFRLGSYRNGSCYVVRPTIDQCKIVPLRLCKLAEAFEDFIRSSPERMQPFNQVTHAGNYRFLTARTNLKGEILAIISVFLGNVKDCPEKLAKEHEAIVAYFNEEKRKELGLAGLMWQGLNRGSDSKNFGEEDQNSAQVIFGETSIIEEICGLKFKISPQSFFQINSKCTEILYNTVRDFAFEGLSDGKKPDVILDLCCGTGTIGMVLLGPNPSEDAPKVVGVEICEEAIEDAKQNVALNNLPASKISYVCGKIEQTLYHTLGSNASLKGDDASAVAVLDPPRAGVSTSVIATIRKCSAIKRLVYVSCSASSAYGNFEDLIREPSRRLQGDAFVLKKAVPIDLFPHTPHCELVLLFER